MAIQQVTLDPSSVVNEQQYGLSAWVGAADALVNDGTSASTTIQTADAGQNLYTTSKLNFTFSTASLGGVNANARITYMILGIRIFVDRPSTPYEIVVDMSDLGGADAPYPIGFSGSPPNTDPENFVFLKIKFPNENTGVAIREAIRALANFHLKVSIKAAANAVGVPIYISAVQLRFNYDDDPPPMLPAYSGPMMELYPTNVTKYLDSGSPIIGVDNLLGPANGSNAAGSVTVNPTGTILFAVSDRYRLQYAPNVPGQDNAIILGWTYHLMGVFGARNDQAWQKGVVAASLQMVNSSLQVISQENGLHETNAYPTNHGGFEEYDDGTFGSPHPNEGPEFIGVMILGNGSGINSMASCNTFSTWHGVALYIHGLIDHNPSYVATVTLDTVRMKTYYIPVDIGSLQTTMTIPASPGILNVAAGDHNLPFDASWGDELPISNPDNTRTVGTNYAQVDINANKGQTEFFRIPIAPGSFDVHAGNGMKELRIKWNGRLENCDSFDLDFNHLSFVTVSEVILMDTEDKEIAAPLKYDVTNFKIGSYSRAGTVGDRTREIVVDISGLSEDDIGKLNLDSGNPDITSSINIRFRFAMPAWTSVIGSGNGPASLLINWFSVTISSSPIPVPNVAKGQSFGLRVGLGIGL